METNFAEYSGVEFYEYAEFHHMKYRVWWLRNKNNETFYFSIVDYLMFLEKYIFVITNVFPCKKSCFHCSLFPLMDQFVCIWNGWKLLKWQGLWNDSGDTLHGKALISKYSIDIDNKQRFRD